MQPTRPQSYALITRSISHFFYNYARPSHSRAPAAGNEVLRSTKWKCMADILCYNQGIGIRCRYTIFNSKQIQWNFLFSTLNTALYGHKMKLHSDFQIIILKRKTIFHPSWIVVDDCGDVIFHVWFLFHLICACDDKMLLHVWQWNAKIVDIIIAILHISYKTQQSKSSNPVHIGNLSGHKSTYPILKVEVIWVSYKIACFKV